MRFSHLKIASSASRYIHAGTVTTLRPGPQPLPAQDQFHRTTTAILPQKRSFLTSNILLQQRDGTGGGSSHGSWQHLDPNGSTGEKPSDTPATTSTPPSGHAKRKRPAAASANVLRRGSSIAQKLSRVAVAQTQQAQAPVVVEEVAEGSNTVCAVCVAEAFNMDRVVAILSADGFTLDPDGTGFETEEVVHARTPDGGGRESGDGGGDVFVFPTGTVVGWALPPQRVTALATGRLLGAAEEPHVARREEEDLEFEVDPHSERSYIRGDRVVLGTRREEEAAEAAGGGSVWRTETTLAKVAFSAGLARSTKLAVLESSLAAYISSTQEIPVRLSRGQPLNLLLRRRFVLQKTGELVLLRAQLNHQGELTDTLPDLLWDRAAELGLEQCYDRVCRALDVDARVAVLNDKVTYANEIAGVLREISSEKHSSRLEWIIIALIAVEVLIELRRTFMEHVSEKGKVQEQAAVGGSS